MPSKRKLAPVVSRDGISGGFSREQEISTVELDTTFGRLLGLAEGQKVGAFRDPSYIHVVLIPCRSDFLCISIHLSRILSTLSH